MKIKSFHVDDGSPTGMMIQVEEGGRTRLTNFTCGADLRIPVIEHLLDGEVTLYPMARIISIEVEAAKRNR